MNEIKIKSPKQYRRDRRKWYPDPIPDSCPYCGTKSMIVRFDNAIRLDCPNDHSHYIWENEQEETLGHTKMTIFVGWK